MTKTVITFILLFITQLTFAAAISRLAEESDLILKGEVVETQPNSAPSGYDMIATVKINELFKGRWNDSIIEIPYCSPAGLHSCEVYYLNEELIVFLQISPSIKTTLGNHGKITLEGKLYDSLTTFLQLYLGSGSETEKTNLILDFISIAPDFSFLSTDLLFMEQRLSIEQQCRILTIVQSSDSVLAVSRFNESQPYRSVDYYDMLLVLEDSEQKKKALEFLTRQLEEETSNFMASRTMQTMCQLTRQRRKCRRILKDYNEENQWSDGTDSINENSQKLIDQFIKEIKN